MSIKSKNTIFFKLKEPAFYTSFTCVNTQVFFNYMDSIDCKSIICVIIRLLRHILTFAF